MGEDSSTDRFRTVFKGAGVVFAGTILELGISFVAQLLIARYLGPTGFGAVSIGVTIMTASSIIVLVGLDSGIGRFLPRYEDAASRRGVLVSGFQIAVPLSLLAAAGIFLAAGPIAVRIFSDASVAPVIRVFAVALPFAALVRLTVGSVQGMQRSLPKVVVQNVALPTTRFLLIAGVLALGLGAVAAAWAYGLAYVVAATIGGYYLARHTPLLADVDPVPMRRELLVFSAPLVVTAAMLQVLSHIDTFIVGYFASTGDVGVYNVVYRLAQLLTVVLSAFGFIVMPTISSLDADDATAEIRRTYQVAAKWILLATLPVFLVIALFPEMVIKLTFGAEYVPGAAALSVLAVGFFTHAIVGPNGNALTSVGRTRLIMYDNVAVAATNVALNFALVPGYGILGAAAATSISYGLLNALYTYQLYRETGIQPFTRGMVRPFGVALALVGTIYWVTTTFFTVTLPLLVVMFGAFLGLYGVVILRFGGIEDEEIMLLWSFEERFGVDLGPLKRVAEKLHG